MTNYQDSIQTLNVGEWTLRIHEPDGPGPHRVFLLLHGWTGDENVMWVFAPRLPKDALLIAPRGFYPAPEGGYSWQPGRAGAGATIDDFRPAVEALGKFLERLKAGVPGLLAVDPTRVNLVGFSQGAALAYTLALLHPQRVERLAGLAGFLPEGAGPLVEKRPLEGKALFVAHGTQDERVPVERARQAVARLEQAGAKVTYCEEEVGHKLSAGCFRGLGAHFRD
jgi:phospholipase/carboxylesterase